MVPTKIYVCFLTVQHCTLCMIHIIHIDIFLGKWGYHRQGSCQAGLGAAIANVSEIVCFFVLEKKNNNMDYFFIGW